MELIECPICDGGTSRPLRHYAKHHLHACVRCNFVYSKAIPTQKELDLVYGNYDYRGENKTHASLQKIKLLAQDIYKINQPRNVLDVGCGKGIMLDMFKDLGSKTFGTEFNYTLQEFAREKGHIILDGGLKPILPPEVRADMIIFTEVIEHIQNPIQVLGHFHGLLNEGGLLYVTTPNFASLERRVLKDRWGMICYPEHLSYYTPRTLHMAMVKTGFVRMDCRTEGISVFRMVEALNKSGTTSADPTKMSDMAQAAVNSRPWLMRSKAIINSFLTSFQLGGSIVALYRKTNTDH